MPTVKIHINKLRGIIPRFFLCFGVVVVVILVKGR